MPQGPIVGVITLTAVISTPSSIVIRPNGVGALEELSTGPIVGLDNYNYVKEIICNDATSYVYNDELTTKTDIYEFEDISIPSGYTYDINSLTVVARNLSICELSPLYDYRIILSTDDGATIFKSPRLPVKESIDLSEFLSADFGSTSWVWSSCPSTTIISWDTGSYNKYGTNMLSQKDTNIPFDCRSADDFIFTTTQGIVTVNWNGCTWGTDGIPILPTPWPFKIYFYDSDGPGGFPGTLLSTYTVSSTPTLLEDLGQLDSKYYSFTADLNPMFVADTLHKYWISIQIQANIGSNIYQWGWATTSTTKQLDEPVIKCTELGITDWTTETTIYSWDQDLSFQLITMGIAPWKELDINDLQIGLEISSPSNTVAHDTYYYPNGTGTYSQLIPHGSANNWENVNDPNNGECYGGIIYNYTTEYTWPYTFDTYNITTETSPIIRAGTINYVKIRAHAMYSGNDGAYCTLVGIIPGYPGSFSGANYTDLSNSNYFQFPIEASWDTHPFTGNPWTWADIDTLEIGVQLQCLSGSNWARLCSVELIVNSNYLEQPTIATSQLYANVNLNLNKTITCTLPKPVDINVNQDIETKGLNFWSGNREVYTIGRSSKRTTLSGLLWDGCTDGIKTCDQIIACVRALGKYKKPIDLIGLRYPDLNVEYNIVAFSWKQIQEKPNTYEWELELEFRDLMNW